MLNSAENNIGYRQWGLSSPKCVFLLVHGLGAHAGRWEALGDFFLNNGISSYAIELGDFTRKGSAEKIAALYDIILKNDPSKKIFIIGESMGAVVSFLLAADRPELFAGIVCLSPAFASRYRPALSDAFGIFAHLLYDKNKQFKLPFNSAMCTRDAEYIKNMDRDPREYRTVPARLILEILRMQFAAKNLGNNFRVPVLFLVSGEDKIVDPAAAEAIFSALKVKDKTFMEFPEMYHSLSIEVGKESVFEEILKWVERRI
ncbi:MAG: alpha/beta fold hydrolase [Candidatus Omnitrophica bacterium]|nr:alpha/beta fold hydrolase [Candidatus Omnitrophota bacterium]